MKISLHRRLFFAEWPLLLLSAAVFSIFLFYTVYFVWITPYPGVLFATVTEGWLVTDSIQPSVNVDDVIVQIGNISYSDYRQDRLLVPFAGFSEGDTVAPIITWDGRTEELVMPASTLDARIRRLVATLWFFPFWIAGTVVLWFLRPRDERWRLLIAFMYLSGIWAMLGSIANWHIAGSRLIFGMVQWLMVPVFIHLHLTVPNPLFVKTANRILPILYGLVILAALSEFAQFPPPGTPLLALVAAILCSFGILIYRSIRSTDLVSDRNASRLMLAGIGLAFGPGILVIFFGDLLGISIPNSFGITIAFLALPILPISYTYAIYKRQLGALEFRANRLISLYSFVIIYPTVFIIILLLGEQWITTSAGRTFYLLFISIAFVLATPPLLSWFQSGFNHLAYGTVHDPDDILRVFARRIPSAFSRDSLINLLTNEITPTLLIRQSILYLFNEGRVEVVYIEGLPQLEIPAYQSELDPILKDAGIYQPPDTVLHDSLGWVRLAIPVIARERQIGVWLLGRRDPDDFYPRNDIDLLQTLSNQIAPVIENIRLYEALQAHADSLAIEVANRTDELREERDRTQAVLDSAGEGIFFTDPAGLILYANPAMSHLSGYTSDELMGKSLELWQAEDNNTNAYRAMWTAIYTGKGWIGELLLCCKDSTFRNVNLAIAPIESHNGAVSGFVGVQSDISKLKEVDRVKSNIISSVSHELKTPLTTIKTYLMLLDRGKAEKRTTYMNILNRETDRLARIINDLLDLSALDRGAIHSIPVPVNIKQATKEALVSCATEASRKNISLTLRMEEDLPMAIVDSNQIEQVITNIVVNALNYTPEGGNVFVSAGTGLLNESTAVWLRIADNGPGISPEEIPHLFERFYRGRAAVDSGVPGTGLGLAICHEIVDRHRGIIQVESEPDHGAAFVVWFPAQNIPDSASKDSASGDHPNAPVHLREKT